MAEPSALSSSITKPMAQWLADATAHETAGRFAEAEALLIQIINAAPDYHPAVHQAAILSYRRKRYLEAIVRFERVLALAPGLPLIHRNICEAYRSQGQLDKAVFHGRRAVELAPEDPVSIYNLGVIHYDRLEIDQAIAAFRRSLALDPNNDGTHFKLAEVLLLSGQFEEGWKEYEHRYGVPGVPRLLPPTDRPQWDGRPMPNGTLLLIGDQGFGDTIQFSRYIPAVAQRCPTVIMACSLEMRPVLMQQPGITRFIHRRDGTLPPFDAYCPLSGLPRLFGTDLGNIPPPVPTLKPDPAKVERWRRPIEALVPRGYRRIGLAWSGRPDHGNDFNRSIALQKLGALAALEGIALLSVQMGPGRNQIGRYFGRAPMIDLGGEIKDFGDTMGIFAHVDRLVTVDTGVAHLAGSMGKPVSILLPFAPDWRWLQDRTDTPWYPTVTLHRQEAPGDWDSAIAKLLRTLVS